MPEPVIPAPMSTRTPAAIQSFLPNLRDYAEAVRDFSWEEEARLLSGSRTGTGLNMAFLAVDRHAEGANSETVALRWIRKDRSFEDFTYNRLQVLSSRFAGVLAGLGVGKGDKVFSLLGRVPALYTTVLGSLRAGTVFCPLFPVFGPEPVFQRMSKGKARVLVTSRLRYEQKIKPVLDRLPELQFILLDDAGSHISGRVLSLPLLMEQAPHYLPPATTGSGDPALLHFTSGTTGMPKGALHVHEAVLTHYVTGKYVLDFHPGDVFWCTADPGWVTGTSYGIISPLVHGITNIFDEEEFDAMRWYSILEEHRVNVWYTAPTAIRRLMRVSGSPTAMFNLSSLRRIYSVGEPLHAGAVLWGMKNFGFPLLDNWWQTETGGIMIANFPSLEVRPGSMGKPLPGIEAGVADVSGSAIRMLEEPGQEGHLVLKAGFPSMFRDYIGEPERYAACFRDGWYLSGDLVRRDADGYFWFVGRADDIIKTSGHMVGPFEVESCLMTHPAVAEAAVAGMPDDMIGERVVGFVVLNPGQVPDDALRLDIIAYSRRKMGPAVAPKEIRFVSGLPRTRSGKILRRLLKARELGLPEGDLSTLENSDSTASLP